MRICSLFLISGKVQGVWYRAATREQAQRLGITGYARNLDDGRVEVLACGDAEAVTKLGEWLYDGPPLASVNKVERQDAAYREMTGFSTM